MHPTAAGPTRRRRRGRRAVLVSAGGLLLVALAGYGAWRAVDGARALQGAADELSTARSAQTDPDALRASLARAGALTDRARSRLDDPVLAVVAHLPVAGRPLATARGLAQAADVAVRQALEPLLHTAGTDVATRLLPGKGRVDLAYLDALARPSADASQALQRARATLERTPADSGVGRVDDARSRFATDLADLQEAVRSIALVTELGPRLLGGQGTRRYLLLAQSPAEARGTGGLLGGYQLLEADGGRLSVVRSGTKADLRVPPPPRDVVDLGPEFTAHYGFNGPTRGWINFNLSPHVPDAGRIAQALWQAQYGQRVDGVLLVDPRAFSLLLGATGPVTDLAGRPLTSENVVDRVLRDVYALYPDQQRQDAYLQQVSESVAGRVLDGTAQPRQLVTALADAAGGRRLQFWSADAAVQARLHGRALAGELPDRDAVGVVVVDSAGSKLDYYLDREVRYRPGCGQGSSTLEVVLRNLAPDEGLPSYVTPEQFRQGRPPGTASLIVTLYAPPGSELGRLTRDDEEQAYRSGTEQGLVWAESAATLEPGQEQLFRLSFRERDGGTDGVTLVEQPLARDPFVQLDRC